MYLPLAYDQINLIEGTFTPSQMQNHSVAFDYWVRSLFQRASSNLIFGLPEFWRGDIENFWYYVMLRNGFVSIQDLTERTEVGGEKIGMCFSPASLDGYNFYYQRTHANISNPTLSKTLRLEIGKECALCCLTPDKMGIWDLIERYAEMLANLDNAINISIINSKTPYILGGKTKAAVQTLKKIMDKVNSGQPAVFYDSRLQDDAVTKDSPFQHLPLFNNPKEAYLTSDQLMDLHTILSDFDSEVGIPTVPYQKKERETEFESQSKVADGQSRAFTWKRSILASIADIKKLYPALDITFKLRWEVNPNVTSEDNTDRSGNPAEDGR